MTLRGLSNYTYYALKYCLIFNVNFITIVRFFKSKYKARLVQ